MVLFSLQFVVFVRVLGLGIASGVIAGSIILTSFIWGKTATSIWDDPPCVMDSPGAASVGVIILIASVGGLAYSGSPAPPVTAVQSPAQIIEPSGTVNSIQRSTETVMRSDCVGIAARPESLIIDTTEVISVATPTPAMITKSQTASTHTEMPVIASDIPRQDSTKPSLTPAQVVKSVVSVMMLGVISGVAASKSLASNIP